MITVLFTILKWLLGMGLAGILIIIGVIALFASIVKSVIVHIYYAIHHNKKHDKEYSE